MSYLNTKPLVYGFEQGAMQDEIELVFDYPARLAQMLAQKTIDVGLIPVAEMPGIPNANIITDFCIGAEGPVASVCLFSHVPVQDISEILMDYQSRSSAALLRLLLKKFFKIQPRLTETQAGYISNIKANTAGLIIGDRAFAARKQFPFVYDLAEAWVQLTGKPFVFAAWVANRKLDVDFATRFNAATGEGLQHISKIALQHSIANYDLHKYYTKNIDYFLTENKRAGLALFLDMLKEIT